MLRARGLFDGRLDEIHKFTLLAVGVMRVRADASAAPLKAILSPIISRLSARGDSRSAITEEAGLLEAAWAEWEEQTAAPFTPAPGKTLAAFKRLLEGDPDSGQAAYPMLSTLKRVYNALLAKWQVSEDECVSWYAEATKVFLEGTAEGDMIRNQVPTDYNPPTPAPTPTPPPTP